jgi:hypothetical protein
MPELFSEMDVSEWIDSLQLWTTLRGPMLRRSFGFFTAIFDSMLSVDSCILIRFLWCFSVFLRCSDASFCICFSFLISLRSCSCFRMMPRCFFFRRDASSILPVSISCLKPHDFHTFYPSLARDRSNTHLSLPPTKNTPKKITSKHLHHNTQIIPFRPEILTSSGSPAIQVRLWSCPGGPAPVS